MNVFAITRDLYPLFRPTVMLFYPLYESVKAIRSPSSSYNNQKYWLTYWILYSLMTLLELSCWQILAWVPFWPSLKLLCCIWLVHFDGATQTFEKWERILAAFRNKESSSDFSEHGSKVLQMLSPDAKKPVKEYIEEYGSEAFESVVKAERTRRLRRTLREIAL